MKGIMDTFTACMKQKFGPIQVDEDCVRRVTGAGHRRLSENWKERLDVPLTTEELQREVNKGGGNKAPGTEGIGTSFFKATWRALKDDMLELFIKMFFENKSHGTTETWSDCVHPQNGKAHLSHGLQTYSASEH
jgi:hypothetical protein